MAPIRKNPTLSDDLISEILVRVPVKSLLRLKSVCKTWLSLIKHPAFVKSQLRHATTSETDQTLIMGHYKCVALIKFLELHVDSRQIVGDLKYPYSRDEFRYVPFPTLVGSANGIVCVAVDLFNFEVRLYLWNPATRQSKVIPTFRDVHHEALGFGYDTIDCDYKVVRVVMPPSFSEVYSSNRNVWRKVPDPIDTPKHGDFDVCVNGLLCGIGDYGLITFDLNKEVLNCGIKLPRISVDSGAAAHDNDNDDDYDYEDGHGNDDDETHYFKIYGRIIEFNKSIGFILTKDNGLNDNKKVYMWTLDDDACLRGGGVEASWTLMFSIDLGMPADIVHGYISNRDLLIIIDESYGWISCNVDKKEAKIVSLPFDTTNHHYNHQIYKYTETLVSLEGFRQVNWNAGYDD